MNHKLHSQQRLGAWRNYFWNADFLDLIADRLALAAVRRALDVGCGQGHWTHALGRVLGDDIQFFGLDREHEWARRARIGAADLPGKFMFCAGDARRLPYGDASFDLVTCQTLLIHLADPIAAIREMVRVLRPGAILLLAEPNNLAQRSVYSAHQYAAGLPEMPLTWRLQYHCERGKRARGEGFNSVGDMLPGWLAQIGLRDIRVYLSDKTLPLIPPYAGAAESELIAMLEQQVATQQWIWSESETRSYYLAGGGAAAEFDVLWRAALAEQADTLSAIRRGAFSSAGGFMMYLVAGRKPI